MTGTLTQSPSHTAQVRGWYKQSKGPKSGSACSQPLSARLGLTPSHNYRPTGTKKSGSQARARLRSGKQQSKPNPQSEVYSQQSFPPPSPAQDRDRQAGAKKSLQWVAAEGPLRTKRGPGPQVLPVWLPPARLSPLHLLPSLGRGRGAGSW